MSVDMEFSAGPDRMRFAPISWPAIFASLTVGLAVMLLLTLVGVAVGVTVVDPGENPGDRMTMAAAGWSAASMLIAAFIGGYVAARCSGLRRTADGVLHGAVSWGATTVLYAVLATTTAGALTAGLFGSISPALARAVSPDRAAQVAQALASPDRDRAMRALADAGFSQEQARQMVDHMAAARGQPASPAARQNVQETKDAVSMATLALTGTLLLCLLLGVGGGALGVRGVRRLIHHRERETTMHSPSHARILGGA